MKKDILKESLPCLKELKNPLLVQPTVKQDTTGEQWFDMPAPILTEELKKDLHILKSRGILDPKRHYKKDTTGELKYFQMGTVIEGPTEYYSSRLTRKERQESFVQELLADQESRMYYKKKYLEIQQAKSKFTRRRNHRKRF